MSYQSCTEVVISHDVIPLTTPKQKKESKSFQPLVSYTHTNTQFSANE